MSSDFVEEIHVRLREELDRLGLKMAEAARAMGEESSQGLRDVCSGRKRASAELMAKLAGIGADVMYVLTGKPSEPNRAISHDLPPEEQLLLEAYRGLPVAARRALLAELLTGGKPKKPSRTKPTADGGVSVSGDGNRVAGRDYREKD